MPFFRVFSAQYRSKIYVLPADGDILFLWYRADVLAAHGMQPPKTWDEFLEQARILNGTGGLQKASRVTAGIGFE